MMTTILVFAVIVAVVANAIRVNNKIEFNK